MHIIRFQLNRWLLCTFKVFSLFIISDFRFSIIRLSKYCNVFLRNLYCLSIESRDFEKNRNYGLIYCALKCYLNDILNVIECYLIRDLCRLCIWFSFFRRQKWRATMFTKNEKKNMTFLILIMNYYSIINGAYGNIYSVDLKKLSKFW